MARKRTGAAKLVTEGKVLVHFGRDSIGTYRAEGGSVVLLRREPGRFGRDLAPTLFADEVSRFCERLGEFTGAVDNQGVRLYATGAFQELSASGVHALVSRVYVLTGLRLNIVGRGLERFYLEQGADSVGSTDMMEGLVRQEFRSVVVCGSFQQSLVEIEEVIACIRGTGAAVLSPASTTIRPETAGTDFILFDYQDHLENGRDTWRHKYEHMEKFSQADAVIVCNPGGRVGNGTMFELGFASAVSGRVVFTERPVGVSVLFPYEVGLDTWYPGRMTS